LFCKGEQGLYRAHKEKIKRKKKEQQKEGHMHKDRSWHAAP
jgi:hypothetical protein